MVRREQTYSLTGFTRIAWYGGVMIEQKAVEVRMLTVLITLLMFCLLVLLCCTLPSQCTMLPYHVMYYS